MRRGFGRRGAEARRLEVSVDASRASPVSPSPGAPPRPSLVGTLGVCALMLIWIVSFRPEPLWWGVIPGFVGALWLSSVAPRPRSFLRWSLLFGALGIGFGYRWLARTVQLFGGVPAAPPGLLTALFGILGVAHGWVVRPAPAQHAGAGPRPHPLTTAALWVACESLRAAAVPVDGRARHGGRAAVRMAGRVGRRARCVSFATLCLVAPLHEAAALGPARARPAAGPARRGCRVLRRGAGALPARARALRRGAGRGARRPRAPRRGPRAAQRRAASPSAPRRTGRARRPRQSAEAYTEGSERAARQGAELIVWPETAVTEGMGFRSDDPAVTNRRLTLSGHDVLNRLGLDHDFLIGAYERKDVKVGITDTETPRDQRWNTAALRQRGDLRARWTTFRKVYLIPFGEAMPLGLPDSFLPQRFRMVPGEPPQALLELGAAGRRTKLLPFLCYEGILPTTCARPPATSAPACS